MSRECIHDADEVEDPMPMLMAISRCCQEGHRDRCDDDTPVDVAPMLSKTSVEVI